MLEARCTSKLTTSAVYFELKLLPTQDGDTNLHEQEGTRHRVTLLARERKGVPAAFAIEATANLLKNFS